MYYHFNLDKLLCVANQKNNLVFIKITETSSGFRKIQAQTAFNFGVQSK